MRITAQLLLTFLVNACWQVALITACAAVCDWLLRGTAARYRHALWVFALLLSVCVPAFSSSNVIKPLLISKQSPVEISDQPIVVSSIVSGDVEPLRTPVSETRVAVEPPRQSFRLSHLSVNQKLAGALVALYLLLLMYRGANLFRAWRRTRKIISSAYEFRFPEPVRGIIQKCRTSVGVRSVRILCSGLVPVPITVGVLNPLVILPESLLHEVDRELLTSAVGHELVHVARRDYLANLICEFIYLPLSFHPAAALVRRRIKQTRELCCDESVAAKLLSPEIYARSLVRLIGSVPITRRLAANTTIGIAESDNLEVRIMSLLRTPKLTPRRKTFLLIVALLLLAVPCVAATSFALTLDIDRQVQSSPDAAPQAGQKLERQSQEREREELRRAARELEREMKTAPESQRAQLEASLREVQKALELHERSLQQYKQQKQEEQLREAEERLAQIMRDYPADEARLKEAREKIAEMERKTPDLEARQREVEKSIAEMQQSESDRKAKLIYKVEPSYTEEARAKKIEGSVLLGLTIDHEGLPQNIQIKRSLEPSLDQAAIEAVRKWRFLPAIKDGQPISMWITVEVNFTVEDKRLDQEQKERAKVKEREMEERAKNQEREMKERTKTQDREMEEKLKLADRYAKGEGQGNGQGNGEGSGSGALEMRRRKDASEQGREERTRKQVEMTRGATITMDRAIQIATSQVPGKVLACSLGRDGDKIFYHLVIITTEGDKSSTTYVWLSATDGQIFKTEKERETREQEW